MWGISEVTTLFPREVSNFDAIMKIKVKKLFFTLLFLFLLIGFVVVLDTPMGSIPALGMFFSPQHGLWQNAVCESSDGVDESFDYPFPSKNIPPQVYINKRGVPYIFAQTWKEALFAQGFCHARDRLFQMDFLSRVAAGRLAEWVGSKALPLDKMNRQAGIPIAAENMELEILKSNETKEIAMAYVAGINFYLANLPKSQYPIEYKLLGVEPEIWNVYKTALIFKWMSWDLTGTYSDAPLSRVRAFLHDEGDYRLLYPSHSNFSSPIISSEEKNFDFMTDVLQPPFLKEEYLFFKQKKASNNQSLQGVDVSDPYPIGSNNWAVHPSITKENQAFLCNDMHLNLTLPSIWYEVQLAVGDSNIVHGISTPGIPFVVAGLNQDIAWGATSAHRDLTDFYAIEWADETAKTYNFDGQTMTADFRLEEYKIKNEPTITDTLWLSHVGPIIPKGGVHQEDITIEWVGKIPSNELLGLSKTNTARTIESFQDGVKYIASPGLTFAFASKDDIGILQWGAFPIKWDRQGDFIMPLKPEYVWKNFISDKEQGQMVDPIKGFVSSANQYPFDGSYPYYLGYNFPAIRSRTIQQELSKKNDFTITDMMHLQVNNENNFARLAIENILAPYAEQAKMNTIEKKYFHALLAWDFVAKPYGKEQAYFYIWWNALKTQFIDAIFGKTVDKIRVPSDMALLELIIDAEKFDQLLNKYEVRQSVYELTLSSFQSAVKKIYDVEQKDTNAILRTTDAQINHLLRLPALSSRLQAGGSKFSINAVEQDQGPSVRLLVAMKEQEKQAFIIYPGGQSGNPGSKWYDDGIRLWAQGEYYPLIFAYKPTDITDLKKRIRFEQP